MQPIFSEDHKIYRGCVKAFLRLNSAVPCPRTTSPSCIRTCSSPQTNPTFHTENLRVLRHGFLLLKLDGQKMLKVKPEALTAIAAEGMTDIAHLLRPAHLQQLSNILQDSEASENDKFVAIELLKNANVAAGMVLPGCQDTGTGIIVGKRGGNVITDGDDESHLSRGVYNTYTEKETCDIRK